MTHPARWLGIACLAGSVLFAARPAAAYTTCVASIDSFDFGSISLTAPTPLTGSVRVDCSTAPLVISLFVGVNYCLSIGAGSGGASASLAPRWLKNAHGDSLDFQLSHTASHLMAVGTTTAPPSQPIVGQIHYLSVLGLIGSGWASHPIHGRIPAQAGAAAGSYASNFGGLNTDLTYRYAETLLGGAPNSCTAGGYNGGTETAPFSVSALVEPECHLVVATDLDFGDVPGVISTAVSASSTVSMTCRRRTAWQMSLNNGLHAQGQTRRMSNGQGQFVHYELYRDAAMTERFGQTEGVDRLVGSGTGTSQSVTVRGRIAAPQTVPAGHYADRVIVTVTY